MNKVHISEDIKCGTKFRNSVPIIQSLAIALPLAVVGGFLDIYTFILHGHVFANAQSGNLVFFAMRMANKDYSGALVSFAPIIAFMMGIFLSEYLRVKQIIINQLKWIEFVLIIEILLLFLIGFIPTTVPDYITTITVGFLCSLQICGFRNVKGKAFATTMCTGNLRLGSEHLFTYFTKKDTNARNNALDYFLVIIFFCIGAGIGIPFVNWFSLRSIWFCCIVLSIILVILLIDNKKEEVS